jgi:hypothetical protein
MRVAEKFRLRGAMKRRLDEGLALGAPHEASARDLSRNLGEPIEGEVAVEIPRETALSRELDSKAGDFSGLCSGSGRGRRSPRLGMPPL